jgi:class 3 adenylate cyclase/pimeloyl-ACP methyl ester carboxylesterase
MERRLAAILAADMVGYSRLMEINEDSVIARQKSHRSEVIDPEITRHRGRIVKTTGDGMLAEFASAQDAVRCAIDIQTSMAAREGATPHDNRILYRVGINLGDVVFDDGDIFGDGVNVAARLEGLAEPGGVCVSDIVHQTVQDRVDAPFRDMGGQRVKNISRAIKVWQWTPDAPREPEMVSDIAHSQKVRYATSRDGVQIAYASVGEGPALLKAPNWLNHLEYEWGSPVWGPVFAEFARRNRLVRFDQRGNGLSDWDVETISSDTMNDDMSAVVEAAGLERFALFGISQGCAFSVRYAFENPDRVKCLILLGGYLRGRLNRGDPEQKGFHEAILAMIRAGWGSPNPLYTNFFTSTYIPDVSPEIARNWDELQRISTNTENALRIQDMNDHMNVVDMAKQLRIPTLVLHCKGDRSVPIAEGRLIARTIPGATFVELPGSNHALMGGTAAFDQFFAEANAFLEEHKNA